MIRTKPAPTKAGQLVRCLFADGYNFTEGREYIVIEYTPPYQTQGAGGFTFPAYVVVLDDAGHKNTCHAGRFEVIR